MERSSSKTSASGIIDDPNAASNGLGAKQRIIPESRRADGSIRKERKVRPGFTPVEDVARFVPSRVRQARADAAASGSKLSTNGVASRETRSSTESKKSSTHAKLVGQDRKPQIASSSPSETSDANSHTDSNKELPGKTTSTNGNVKHIKKPPSSDVPESWDDDDHSGDQVERKDDTSVDEITKELQSVNIKNGI
ncbi:uncharacterized protein FA14DRAFT_190783 [Meira miltonrushii]|uniref:WIBG Mago-binding domain-containing protein n=1 Tax=Meira miltonrushii TaxID=1280837 RepID=A0A316V854_9BASI|nr:uncharacterized protein FA14DRAFT_190783 [Meira miltonrushii]PWN33652.1 hypothetical protein FA14DRAFT_190783 [Meira miltonrushii]